MSDPMDPGTDLGEPDPPAGTPTPTAADPKDQRIALLEQENAKLREDKRTERARALGAEHKLPASVVDLLKTVPADQMEDRAKALAAELHPAAPATPPSPPAGGTPPADPGQPPAEPPAPVDPTLASFEGLPGGQPTDAALGYQDELRERLGKAESLEEIEAIQQELKQRQKAGQTG
jgi:hypothetical protein